MLTDKQIDVITEGVFSHWARNGILVGANSTSVCGNGSGQCRTKGQTRLERALRILPWS